MSTKPLTVSVNKDVITKYQRLNEWLLEFIFLMVSASLVFLGMLEFFCSWAAYPVLAITDPVFGVDFRWLMLAMGIGHLAVAFLILFTRYTMLALGLTAWLAVNFIVFRVGLWKMGWIHSSGFSFQTLGFSLKSTDAVCSLLAVFLLIASCATISIWNRKLQATTYIKNFCPVCGGHVKFAKEREGEQIACPHCSKVIKLRRQETLKMSCFFCQGHIEFPAHAIGQKTHCPHCNMDITLKEPA